MSKTYIINFHINNNHRSHWFPYAILILQKAQQNKAQLFKKKIPKHRDGVRGRGRDDDKKIFFMYCFNAVEVIYFNKLCLSRSRSLPHTNTHTSSWYLVFLSLCFIISKWNSQFNATKMVCLFVWFCFYFLCLLMIWQWKWMPIRRETLMILVIRSFDNGHHWEWWRWRYSLYVDVDVDVCILTRVHVLIHGTHVH